MWENKSIVCHFENHTVTQRSSHHAYSLGALVIELILKKRITMQCNFWTSRSYKWRFLQCIENIFISAAQHFFLILRISIYLDKFFHHGSQE